MNDRAAWLRAEQVGGSRVWARALCAAFVLGACADDTAAPESDAGSAPGEDPSADYTVFEVEWKPDAVVLDDVGAVQDALVSLDTDAGEIVLADSLAGLDALVPGSFALLGGVGIFRIVERESSADGELLRVEEALLTDVIDNGRIEWQRSFVSAPPDAKLGLDPDDDHADTVRALPEALTTYKDGKLEYTGKLGQFDTKFTLTPSDSDLKMTLSTKLASGTAMANAAVRGTVTSLTNDATIQIDSGSLEYLRVRFINVQGEVEIEAGAVEIGLPDVKVKVPARLTLPIVIGGIPFYVDVGGSIEWVSTLRANATARFNGHARYHGGVGVVLKGTDSTPLASFEQAEVSTGEVEQVGTIAAGLGVLMNFPELGVGLGLPKTANVGAAFKFKTEVLTNFALRYEAAGNVPVITGNCLTSKTNFGATLVGEAKLLGFKATTDEVSLFAELGDEQKSGSACDD